MYTYSVYFIVLLTFPRAVVHVVCGLECALGDCVCVRVCGGALILIALALALPLCALHCLRAVDCRRQKQKAAADGEMQKQTMQEEVALGNELKSLW